MAAPEISGCKAVQPRPKSKLADDKPAPAAEGFRKAAAVQKDVAGLGETIVR